MGHLQDIMLRSDTISPTREHWEVDGIFAFCYKVRIPLGKVAPETHRTMDLEFFLFGWMLNANGCWLWFDSRSLTRSVYSSVWQVMFQSGYLTLFGKDFGENKCEVRQAAQKALVLNALENFKEFDKIFPALVAGLPIHVFKSAYSAREVSPVPSRSVKDTAEQKENRLCLLVLFDGQNLAKTMHAEKLSKRENISDLISMRMILNDSLSTFNDVSKSRTHVALLWASQANTLPATFWSLFYLIR